MASMATVALSIIAMLVVTGLVHADYTSETLNLPGSSAYALSAVAHTVSFFASDFSSNRK